MTHTETRANFEDTTRGKESTETIMMMKTCEFSKLRGTSRTSRHIKYIADSLIERNLSKIVTYNEFIISSVLSMLMKKTGR